jgi:uncharacterized membrane protein YphA (DoxX/SURF4 family)
MSDRYYSQPVAKVSPFWDVILLILRVWFGYVMMNNGKFFFKLFSPTGDQKFFEDWFVGSGMRLPLPLMMIFEAKGAEFFGGLLVFLGLFTRFGAAMAALAILITTLAINLSQNRGFDGTNMASFCLFATILMYWGGGRYAMDSLIKKNSRAF